MIFRPGKLTKKIIVMLIVVFLFSFTHYAAGAYYKRKLVLFFPVRGERVFTGEIRTLKRKLSEEENIRLLISELLLGPADILHDRLVSREARLKSVLFRDGKLYIDLSFNTLFSESENRLVFEEIIRGIKKSVYFNFRNVKKIFISIEGSQPLENTL
jgi:hypothetical protein